MVCVIVIKDFAESAHRLYNHGQHAGALESSLQHIWEPMQGNQWGYADPKLVLMRLQDFHNLKH